MRLFLCIVLLLSVKVTAGVFELIYTKAIDCREDEECQNYLEGSKCIYYNCACPKEKLLSSDGAKCLDAAYGFGDECEDNVQCSDTLKTGGVCTDNKCKCKTGFHYFNEKCWKNVDLYESCLTDEQCFSAHEYVGLQCDHGICKCRPNYYERLSSGCRRKMKVGERCNLDTDCPEEATCDSMTCSDRGDSDRFNLNYFNFDEINSTYYAVEELGGSCTKDSDCSYITNAICLENNKCACTPVLFVASADNRRCLKASRGKVKEIEKSVCEENAQCAVFGGNSICKNKKCACKDGTYWEVNNQFCWPVKPIGEKCSRSEDCHPSETFAECLENVCTCQTGYHQKGNACLLDATKVGDYCEENADCLFQFSFCNDSNACACQENYFPQNGYCLGGVKSACRTDADCCHLKNTRCRNSSSLQCLCIDDYVSSDEGSYCLPAVNFGKECQESFQCKTYLGEYGECRDGVCGCQNKTHYIDGKCYRSKMTKESCSRLQDCYPGHDANSVICLKGFCACHYDYKLDADGVCVKTSSTDGMKPLALVILAALLLSG